MPCISTQFNPAIGPLLNVYLAPAGTLKSQTQSGAPLNGVADPLLLDSGADITCISPNVANRLNLTPLGKRDVNVVTGQSSANTYMIDIGILFGSPSPTQTKMPIGVVENITVMEFSGPTHNYQGLIGRDIICQGMLTVIGYAGTFTFCL